MGHSLINPLNARVAKTTRKLRLGVEAARLWIRISSEYECHTNQSAKDGIENSNRACLLDELSFRLLQP